MKHNSRFFWLFSFIFIASGIMVSCHNPMGTQPLDETPTRGNIRIAIDESFQLLFDTQIYTFESLYPDAKIKALYKPENDVFNDFMNDSIRTVALSHDLTQDQKDLLLSKKFIVRSTKVAHDALALIVNHENKDSLLTISQLEDLFKNKLNSWNQINPKSKSSVINVVFDNNNSGNVRYFRDKFELKSKFPSNFFAVNSNQEIITYVEKNPNALGIISVNWISDKQDSISHRFLKNIRVVAVGNNISDACKPYQGYIADGSYPFCRDVYMVSRETFSGLGTGFVSFVASDQGQRIILKSGIVPATMPLRLVQIKKK